jgi:hypothetical protein
MNRIWTLLFAVLLVAMGIFTILAFVPAHPASDLFWPAYGFTMAAFFLQIVLVRAAFKNADSLKKAFLGIPIVYAGLGYLAVQFILGLGGIFTPVVGSGLYVTLCAVLLGFFLVIILFAAIGREAIQGTEDGRGAKTLFMKSLLADAEILAGMIADAELKKGFAQLAETIRYSDPVSVPALAELEGRIRGQFAGLRGLIDANDPEAARKSCRDLRRLLEERNVKTKALK